MVFVLIDLTLYDYEEKIQIKKTKIIIFYKEKELISILKQLSSDLLFL